VGRRLTDGGVVKHYAQWCRSPYGSKVTRRQEHAWQRLNDLAGRNPDRAWHILLRVLEVLPAPESDRWPYEALGADGLEVVMANGGDAFIDRAIHLLDVSPRFAAAAANVMLDRDQDPAWQAELRRRGLRTQPMPPHGTIGA
jgi:hypothetical protein